MSHYHFKRSFQEAYKRVLSSYVLDERGAVFVETAFLWALSGITVIVASSEMTELVRNGLTTWTEENSEESFQQSLLQEVSELPALSANENLIRDSAPHAFFDIYDTQPEMADSDLNTHPDLGAGGKGDPDADLVGSGENSITKSGSGGDQSGKQGDRSSRKSAGLGK